MGSSPQSHAKVDQLSIRSFFVTEDNVFGFDIPMDQLLAVHILNSFGDLVDVELSLCFFHPLLWLNSIEKVSSSSELLDHDVGALGFIGTLVSGDDVGVVAEVSAIFELSFEVRPFGISFANSFYRNEFAEDLVFSNPGCAVGALASLLDEAITLVEVRTAVRTR